jgi:hypothetical protein
MTKLRRLCNNGTLPTLPTPNATTECDLGSEGREFCGGADENYIYSAKVSCQACVAPKFMQATSYWLNTKDFLTGGWYGGSGTALLGKDRYTSATGQDRGERTCV